MPVPPSPHDVTPPRCTGCRRAVPPHAHADRSCSCTRALAPFPPGAWVTFSRVDAPYIGRVTGARITPGVGAEVAVSWLGGSAADGLWLDPASLVRLHPVDDVDAALRALASAVVH